MNGGIRTPKGGVIAPADLLAFRTSLGMDQRQLAAKLDISDRTISHWEVGRYPILPRSARLIVALAKELNVPAPKVRGRLRGGKKHRKGPPAPPAS